LDREPDIVVSGINLGYNITMPMILSSGTVGAAMEASLLGHRAVACSMCLPNDEFEDIRKSGGKKMGKKVEKSLRNSPRQSRDTQKIWPP
jgi:5'-nucleotidase